MGVEGCCVREQFLWHVCPWPLQLCFPAEPAQRRVTCGSRSRAARPRSPCQPRVPLGRERLLPNQDGSCKASSIGGRLPVVSRAPWGIVGQERGVRERARV